MSLGASGRSPGTTASSELADGRTDVHQMDERGIDSPARELQTPGSSRCASPPDVRGHEKVSTSGQVEVSVLAEQKYPPRVRGVDQELRAPMVTLKAQTTQRHRRRVPLKEGPFRHHFRVLTAATLACCCGKYLALSPFRGNPRGGKLVYQRSTCVRAIFHCHLILEKGRTRWHESANDASRTESDRSGRQREICRIRAF